jgi:thymidine kinase
MFSGKSEELVRRLRRAMLAGLTVQVFKPACDTRHGPDLLVTRDGRQVAATSVADSSELATRLDPSTQVVGIDEVQFFDEGIVPLVEALADQGRRVVLAGLDLDFARRPFGPMPFLLALAERVDKMHAVCMRCGLEAHYSQRVVPATVQLLVGDLESYEARCRRCYEPPRL